MQKPDDGASVRTTGAIAESQAHTTHVENYESGEPVVSVPAPSDARTRPRGTAPPPISPRGLNARKITHNGVTWVDIIHPGEEEIEFLRRTYGFHPLHLDDTLSKIQRPKIDDGDDYTFIVMHFPVYSKLVRITTPSEVDFFVGANYVITVHNGNLKPLTRLFKQCAEELPARQKYMGRSAGYLLYTIVDRLVDYCFPILNKIDQNIEQIEDEIFEERVRLSVQEISVVRRDVIAFRRLIKPLIPVINSLERKTRPFLNEDMEEYFGDIADHLSKIWDTLEDYKEVIEGLSDTVNSLTNNRTNEIIKVLTIISVILLPMTLITGIYGMNIDLPAAQHPLAFWLVVAIMIGVMSGMLGFFKWRKWI
ncbi:MAG: magnesium/cobalt transporter CorA [Chloroflexota bacterium]